MLRPRAESHSPVPSEDAPTRTLRGRVPGRLSRANRGGLSMKFSQSERKWRGGESNPAA